MNTVSEMDVCYKAVNTEEEEVEDGELIDDDINVPHLEGDVLNKRAKRFGLTESMSSNELDPKLKKLYSSMGVNKETRKQALHLHGTDGMKTPDVFAYFSDYSPASIEWLSDNSCNVVWLDEEACAKALLNLSIPIKGQNISETDDVDEVEEIIHLEDIRCALPPGIWRKGQSHTLAPSLFMRFATCYDKKVVKALSSPLSGNVIYNRTSFLDEGDEVAQKPRHYTGNPWSDIALQWRRFESRTNTVPVKDARDLLRNKEIKRPKTVTERLMRNGLEDKDEPKNDLLVARKMQADIEEKKIMERNKLRANKRERTEPDLRDRLGRKRKRDYIELEEKDMNWKDDEREDIIRIEIDNSGGQSDDEWEDCESDRSSDSDEVAARPNICDLRKKLQMKKSIQRNDDSDKSVLRTRYMKYSGKRNSFSPLRIEIDNNRSDED